MSGPTWAVPRLLNICRLSVLFHRMQRNTLKVIYIHFPSRLIIKESNLDNRLVVEGLLFLSHSRLVCILVHCHVIKITCREKNKSVSKDRKNMNFTEFSVIMATITIFAWALVHHCYKHNSSSTHGDQKMNNTIQLAELLTKIRW